MTAWLTNQLTDWLLIMQFSLLPFYLLPLRPDYFPSAPCSRKLSSCASPWTCETKFYTRTEKMLHTGLPESVRWCVWSGAVWRDTAWNWNWCAVSTVMKINKIGSVRITWHCGTLQLLPWKAIMFALYCWTNISRSLVHHVEVLPWERYNISLSISNVPKSSCTVPHSFV